MIPTSSSIAARSSSSTAPSSSAQAEPVRGGSTPAPTDHLERRASGSGNVPPRQPLTSSPAFSQASFDKFVAVPEEFKNHENFVRASELVAHTVEKLYSRKTWEGPGELYKSANKLNHHPAGTPEAAREYARIDKAYDAMDYANDKSDRDAYMAKLLAAPSHQCDQLVEAAQHFARQFYPGLPTAIVGFSNMSRIDGVGHMVLVLGNIPHDMAKKPVEEWDASLAIVDPWSRIAATPQLYRARLQAKLDAWADHKMLMVHKGTPLQPGEAPSRWAVANSPPVKNMLTGSMRLD